VAEDGECCAELPCGLDRLGAGEVQLAEAVSRVGRAESVAEVL
jgi:hypothetical protein